ncbi:hypothetical protein POM88_019973 [Heracleum sosnowskyi]|uniref:Uncharacterized protein n=1 Tax=Heracleum sosnowskyi TaxID=360622 RepID=A0AAD8IBP2_9APIA|nr:hypothetical protein POM88_019973 [Heracleum sosnowskyi]
MGSEKKVAISQDAYSSLESGEYEAKMSEIEKIKEDASEAERKFGCREIYSGRMLIVAWFVMLVFLSIYFPVAVSAMRAQDNIYMTLGVSFLLLCMGGILFASIVMTTLSQTMAYVQAKLLIRKAKHLECFETLI